MSSISLGSFVVCLTTNGLDFCQSYRRKGLRVIIIEEYYKDLTFMVIDRQFWKVKYENETFVFDPLDKKAVNPSEQFVEAHEGGPRGRFTTRLH